MNKKKNSSWLSMLLLISFITVSQAKAQESPQLEKPYTAKQYDKCIAQCEKTLKKDSLNPDALLFLAASKLQLTSGEENLDAGSESWRAIALYKKFQKSTPAKIISTVYPKVQTEAKQLIGQIYAKVGQRKIDSKDYAGAYQLFYEGLRDFPQNAAILEVKKKLAIQDYQENFVGSQISTQELGWTGSVGSCQSGSISAQAETKLLQRLNYIRRLAGVPDACVFDPASNKMCQDAALIMKANNMLTHAPYEGLKCFTKDGYTAAHSGNLTLSTKDQHSSEALLLQVFDNGVENGGVPHRRWILNPEQRVFGVGSTDNSLCLRVTGIDNAKHDPSVLQSQKSNYVCWPPMDYAPSAIIPERWSIGIDKADFSKATVEMYDGKTKVLLKILPNSKEVGPATLVWTPEINSKLEKTYKVLIKNVYLPDEKTGKMMPKAVEYYVNVLAL